MSINALAEISRYYGANPDYVLAGGGNTSWKDGDALYVKASGASLADVVPDAFVKMNRKALAAIWEKQYPALSAEREGAVLADMMAARQPGEEQKRPSVEALLHDILPFAYVVHTHPALVNGLTCSRRGEAAMKEIFEDDAIWIPSINPGYILAQAVKSAMDAHAARRGKKAALVFLQNHGVFVGADSVNGIKETYGEIMSKIGAMIRRRPDFSDEQCESGAALYEAPGPLGEIARTLAELSGGTAALMRNNETAALVKNHQAFLPVSSAFSPDHIVYAGSDPLFTAGDALVEAWKHHVHTTGRKPKIVAIQDIGIFGAASTEKAALLALTLFKDAIKVSVYAESFGGPCFMAQDKIDFINNWEVERFRSSVSIK
jgi:rhamnose utilization protein RhaD (predicted bifunctional aldolase and dehydrogenase)